MRRIILFAIIIGFISCDSKNSKTTNAARDEKQDNPELIEIFKSDQADRTSANMERNILNKNDSLRKVRIYELLDSNKVRTATDYNNAALILHHGEDSVAYGVAVKLMRKSIELDSTRNKWLLAAAIDRELLSRNRPQIYGTQYRRPEGKPFERMEMDTTVITDAERIEYGVETLAQQREKVILRNRKRIQEFLNEGKSVNELIQFIKHEDISSSKYDFSESAINAFAYQLMNQEKMEEALAVLKLNTELYPDGYNAFDSYGECLLKMGDKEKAIIAYKKSLDLNPDNNNAEKVLSEIQK
jgi:tetratricopeptide (TPR) repeat protein